MRGAQFGWGRHFVVTCEPGRGSAEAVQGWPQAASGEAFTCLYRVFRKGNDRLTWWRYTRKITRYGQGKGGKKTRRVGKRGGTGLGRDSQIGRAPCPCGRCESEEIQLVLKGWDSQPAFN